MRGLTARIEQAVRRIRDDWSRRPQVGIVLGTGLGGFSDQIDSEAVIGYDCVPHMPPATALDHTGQFVCGQVGHLPVIAMEGRLHGYEGYALWQTTLPIRIMQALGIGLLVTSNASGGLNPQFSSGDIVVIEDHINLMSANPLLGVVAERASTYRSGRKVSDYDPILIGQALQTARRKNITAHRGVYAAVRGPNYETRAEYRFLRTIGADVVGMSTVPEVQVASQLGLRVLALSVVTNVCRPDAPQQTDGAAVVAAAAESQPRMRDIVLEVLHSEGHGNIR